MSRYRVPPDVPPPIVVKVTPQLIDWLSIMLHVLRGAMQGNLNVAGTTPLTLAASAATTTLADPRIGGTTVVLLQPTTANAAAALTTTYFNTPTKVVVAVIGCIALANNATLVFKVGTPLVLCYAVYRIVRSVALNHESRHQATRSGGPGPGGGASCAQSAGGGAQRAHHRQQ